MSSKMQEKVTEETKNEKELFKAAIHSGNVEKETGIVTYDLSGNRLKVTIVCKHENRQSGMKEAMNHLTEILLQLYAMEDEISEYTARIKDAGVNSIRFYTMIESLMVGHPSALFSMLQRYISEGLEFTVT